MDASGARRTGSGTILSNGNGSSLPPIKCAVQRSASAGAAIIGAASGTAPVPVPMAAQHGAGLSMRPNSLSISKHAASGSSGNLLLHAAAPELLRAMSCTPGAPAATAPVLGPQAVPLALNASASAQAPAGGFTAGLHALAWQSPASTAMATTTAAAPGSKMVRVPLDIALEAAMLAHSAGDSSLPPLPAPLQHPMVASSALQGCSVWPELTGLAAMPDAASAAMTSPPYGLNASAATAAAAQQLLAVQHQDLLASMLVQQSLAATEQQQQQRQEQDRLQEMWFAAFTAAKGVGLGDPEAAACADCAVKQTAAAAAPAVPSAVCSVSTAAPGCPAAAASMLAGGMPVDAQLLHQQQGQQQLQALQLTAALQQQQQQEQQLLASLMLGNGMQQHGQPLVDIPHCKQVETGFDVLGHLGGITSAFAGLLQ